MARRRRQPSRASSAINITPLGDVSLSLLLGFLVITPVLIETMAATLPQEGSGVAAGAVRQDPIVVLTAEGDILVNGKEVASQDLGQTLRELLLPGAPGQRKVLFTGSGEVEYRNVIHLLDLLRANGVDAVGIR